MTIQQIQTIIYNVHPDIEPEALSMYTKIILEANKIQEISSFNIAVPTYNSLEDQINNITIIMFEKSLTCKNCINQFLKWVTEYTDQDPGVRYGDDYIILEFDA